MNEGKRLTPAQAQYVLGRLMKDRRVSARDVAQYLASMQGEIRALEDQLSQLRSVAGGTVAAPQAARPGRRRRRTRAEMAQTATAPAPAKKKIVLSPQQRASRQLQGVYMSMIRQFPKSKRTAIKGLAKEKGREAAVDMMKADLAKKK